jgi:hypothetical protein
MHFFHHEEKASRLQGESGTPDSEKRYLAFRMKLCTDKIPTSLLYTTNHCCRNVFEIKIYARTVFSPQGVGYDLWTTSA